MTFGSENTKQIRFFLSFENESLTTFQIDRDLTDEIVRFETIVIPDGEFEFFVLNFFSMQISVGHRLFPDWIQRFRDVFRSTFVFGTEEKTNENEIFLRCSNFVREKQRIFTLDPVTNKL